MEGAQSFKSKHTHSEKGKERRQRGRECVFALVTLGSLP